MAGIPNCDTNAEHGTSVASVTIYDPPSSNFYCGGCFAEFVMASAAALLESPLLDDAPGDGAEGAAEGTPSAEPPSAEGMPILDGATDPSATQTTEPVDDARTPVAAAPGAPDASDGHSGVESGE